MRWTKPRLGLYEYAGNSCNNICYPHFGSVVKDTADPDPRKRYKMVVKPKPVGPPAHLAYSADGFQWVKGPELTLPDWPERPPDIAAFLCDSEDPDPSRRFKLIWQSFVTSDKPGPEEVRAKCLSYGPTPEQWRSSTANPILSPVGNVEHENHFLMLARHAGYLVMPYEFSWYSPTGSGLHGSYCGDVRLAVSADGDHFYRLNPHEPLIARGRSGEWDEAFIVISDKLAIKDDTMYFFYAGHGREWTSWPGSNVAAGVDTPSAYARTDRMGLATLPLDRFTGIETADRETCGRIDTATLDLGDDALELFANVRRHPPGTQLARGGGH